MSTALRWYAQERAPELASSAQISYAVEHLVGFFRNSAVSTLTPQRLKEYEAHRRGKNIARGTIRRELAVLSAAVNHAEKNGRLVSAPKVFLPSPGKARTRHLDDDEVRRLIDAARPVRHVHLFVLLALNTGARKGALLELTWTQVQFDQGLIYLNPEGRDETTKGRAIVPMNATLRAALTEERERRRRPPDGRGRAWPSSPFVIQYRGGRVLDVKRGIAEACERAGLTGVSAHTLRHTAGSIMAREGVDLYRIANVLGHSYAKTTELYAHLRPEWLKQATDALGRVTGGPRVVTQVRHPETEKGSPDDQ